MLVLTIFTLIIMNLCHQGIQGHKQNDADLSRWEKKSGRREHTIESISKKVITETSEVSAASLEAYLELTLRELTGKPDLENLKNGLHEFFSDSTRKEDDSFFYKFQNINDEKINLSWLKIRHNPLNSNYLVSLAQLDAEITYSDTQFMEKLSKMVKEKLEGKNSAKDSNIDDANLVIASDSHFFRSLFIVLSIFGAILYIGYISSVFAINKVYNCITFTTSSVQYCVKYIRNYFNKSNATKEKIDQIKECVINSFPHARFEINNNPEKTSINIKGNLNQNEFFEMMVWLHDSDHFWCRINWESRLYRLENTPVRSYDEFAQIFDDLINQLCNYFH